MSSILTLQDKSRNVLEQSAPVAKEAKMLDGLVDQKGGLATSPRLTQHRHEIGLAGRGVLADPLPDGLFASIEIKQIVHDLESKP